MRHIFETILVGTLLSAGIAAPALAENGRNEKTVEVFVGDLDLSNVPGQAALHARLLDAAKDACSRPGDDVRRPSFRTERKICIADAMESAYASTNIHRPYVALNR
jgi:UrcA family protein